jgi:hypothetical protein
MGVKVNGEWRMEMEIQDTGYAAAVLVARKAQQFIF